MTPREGGWEEALADVETNMPEAWVFTSLYYVAPWSKLAKRSRHGSHWRAVASRRGDLGLRPAAMTGIGETGQLALRRLADHLTGVKV